uniref:Glutathione peroxidase n=1 Tax=Chlorella sp. NJ-18 TaxID=371065 RepID=I1VWQ5_9CHLO|nr:GPX2a [Chlorella sp. NJ-18]
MPRRQAALAALAAALALLLLAAASEVAPSPDELAATSLYDSGLSALDAHGNKKEMSELAGKVTLVVNVASLCGYTDSNYKGLTSVWDKYHEYGLEILAFPCNQFGEQEPASLPEIESFLGDRFQVKFSVMEKVEVNGAQEHPIFSWLKSHTPGEQQGADVAWNFEKWLVNKAGHVVKRYKSDFTLHEVEQAVYAELVGTGEAEGDKEL